MKLFLSGGGSGLASIEVDKKFIETTDRSKPVLYIPIAMDELECPYPGCLEWLKGNFSRFSFDHFVMWTQEDLKNKIEKDFDPFGGIYIDGGNTLKLLSDLKEFGTFKIPKSLAEKNVPIYGGSAGAMILTQSIKTCEYLDKNEIGLADLSALNLAHADIWCHYDPAMENDLSGFKKSTV